MKITSLSILIISLVQSLETYAAANAFSEEDRTFITAIASGKSSANLKGDLIKLESFKSIPKEVIPNYRYALVQIGDKLLEKKDFKEAGKAYYLALELGSLENNYDFKTFVETDLGISAAYSSEKITDALVSKYSKR